MRAIFLVLVLLAAGLALPSAQAATWSVDALVTVRSATSADYTLTISGITNTNLALPRPDDTTLVRAYDSAGKSVTVENITREGAPWIQVSIRDKPATVLFALAGKPDGAFSIFAAQVPAQSETGGSTGSPVTVGLALPAGWSLSGYRDSDDGTPDAHGVFQKIGPAYVQYLALQPGYTDPGPDAGVSGRSVRRVGASEITSTKATWSITTTYDTDVYSRAWDVFVPDGATVVDATSAFGPVPTTREGDILRVTAPYPVGFALGARSFTVNMTLPPPEPHGGTFRQVNLSVRAAEDDDVRIVARVLDDSRYAGARVAGGTEIAPLQFRGRGPVSAGIALLPAPAPDHMQFVVDKFVVDAPRSLEAAARATATNASGLLARTSSFAFLPNDTRPFYVAYTDADVFAWEQGFYSNGLNTITIRASTLANASDGLAHLEPVSVLVHEATHGLVDRRMPHAPHDLSFLHEGLSRLAETHVEALFPASEIVTRSGEQYFRHSARPGIDEVQDFHKASTSFDVAWGANDVSDAQRGFLYDYSGLVLHAYEQRAPPGALANFLSFVNATNFTSNDATDSQTLLDLLLQNSPGTTSIALLYPGREAASLKTDEFRACMGNLVAPPYPWEEARTPAGGCPATGYGPRSAALPTPPAPIAPVPEPEPEFEATPPPKPPFVVATPAPEGVPVGIDDEAPGAVIEPPEDHPASPGTSRPAVVPGPGLAMLSITVIALALTRRRRP